MDTGKKITISAVITTFRRPVRILKRAVESVCSQSRLPDELIVINDFPEDTVRSESIKKMLQGISIDIPVKYLLMESNSGAAAVRNRGLEVADGKYIAFLDDDDIWMEDKLKIQEQAVINNPDAVLVTGYILCHRHFGRIARKTVYNKGWEYDGSVLSEILGTNFVGGCSAPLVKRDGLISCGGFDGACPASEDYDAWIRLAMTGVFVFIKRPLVKYYLHHDSLTGDLDKNIDAWLYIYRKYRNDYQKNPISAQYFFYTAAIVCQSRRAYDKADAFFVKGLRAGGWNLFTIKVLLKLIRVGLFRKLGIE